MRTIHIAPNGTIELLVDETPNEYPALNRRFGIEMIEQVSCQALADRYGLFRTDYVVYPRALMLVSENGIAEERTYNPSATVLYAPNPRDRAHHGGRLAIFGDAYLISNRDTEEGPEWADLDSDIDVASVKSLIAGLY